MAFSILERIAPGAWSSFLGELGKKGVVPTSERLTNDQADFLAVYPDKPGAKAREWWARKVHRHVTKGKPSSASSTT